MHTGNAPSKWELETTKCIMHACALCAVQMGVRDIPLRAVSSQQQTGCDRSSGAATAAVAPVSSPAAFAAAVGYASLVTCAAGALLLHQKQQEQQLLL